MDQLSCSQALAKMATYGQSYTDLLGYVACVAVLITFCMQTMLPLRMAAVGSNIAFIAYAWLARLLPILTLHCILLAINLASLLQCALLRAKRGNSKPTAAGVST